MVDPFARELSTSGIRPRRHATVDAQRMAGVTDHAGNATVATND
jgi:hypothetical protein